MKQHSPHGHADRVDGVFLRSIGRLSLSTWDLTSLRRDDAFEIGGAAAWGEFADHLSEAADAVREAACGSSFAGNTIAVLRHGVRVPVDVEYVDRLAEKIDRHVRVGRALGVDVDPTDGTSLSA